MDITSRPEPQGYVINGVYVEMTPLPELCMCTNDQLEAGHFCGQPDCGNEPSNLEAFRERRRKALEAAR